MYTEYFGLKAKPFSIAPDPQYFFMSRGHKEAIAHLLYGIKSDGGFVLLTGEVGTGKTTVCRLLLQLIPPDTETAFILNPKMTAEELLAAICDEFRIEYPPNTTSIKTLVALINEFLLTTHERGRKAVLIIEEAQNLTPDVLEQVRLLTNLETDQQKLLQIIMLGQPELRDLLAKPELRQLSQRITARYHLGPLSPKEILPYVSYRLSVAGLLRGQPFPPSTLRRLFALTRGIPRLINVILDRALLGAYVEGKDHVNRKILITAAREVAGRTGRRVRFSAWPVLAGCVFLVCAMLFGLYYYSPTPKIARNPMPFLPFKQHAVGAKGNPDRNPPVSKTSPTTRFSNRDGAYKTLFSEWGIDYRPDSSQTVCEQARQQGLQCIQAKGTIAQLRKINKPVVLVLHDRHDSTHYAVLTALRGDTGTVTAGGETKTFDTEQIERIWSGEYLLIRQGPPNVDRPLKPGGRGPLVAWLDRQLAHLQGRPMRTASDQVYNEKIVRQVKEFQRNTGLDPDGVVGPKTVMHLSTVAGDSGPVLYREMAR